MAYTYDDFIKAASADGMLNSFNKYDLETAKKNPEFGLSVLSLMKDAKGAGTSEAKLLADAGINNLRKTYGNYTIGDDGSYVFAGSGEAELKKLMEQSANYGEFTYDGQSELDKLQAAVTNPDPFAYDAETDPLYGSYKKTYLREGDRTYDNVLAQMAAANGGQVSTSALAAAQQAQNYYGAQLADVIPTLRQNAYNEYLQGIATKQNALDVLLADREAQQQDWLTDFEILQTNIGNLQAKNQEEYTAFLDRETLANNAIANALTQYQTLGYATPEVAAVLGIQAGTKYPTSTGSTTGGSTAGSTGSVVTPANYSGNGAASMEDVAGLQAYLNTLGAGLAEDGKYGSLSAKAVKDLTGQDLTAEEAVNLWNQGLLVAPGSTEYGDMDFDVNNLVAIAPAGMDAAQIQAALNGDAKQAEKLASWLVEKVASGQLTEYTQNGKTKFMWKV